MADEVGQKRMGASENTARAVGLRLESSGLVVQGELHPRKLSHLGCVVENGVLGTSSYIMQPPSKVRPAVKACGEMAGSF